MKLVRTSAFTGVTREKEIDITPEQYALWESGVFIQNAAPHLSAEDREFIITGVTHEEWVKVLGSLM
jgi:hypothetical protein